MYNLILVEEVLGPPNLPIAMLMTPKPNIMNVFTEAWDANVA